METPIDGDNRIPLLMLIYMGYGFNYTTGECEGGMDSTGWNRQQERFFYPEAGYYCTGNTKLGTEIGARPPTVTPTISAV